MTFAAVHSKRLLCELSLAFAVRAFTLHRCFRNSVHRLQIMYVEGTFLRLPRAFRFVRCFCFLSLCVAITKSKNKHLFFIGIVSVMKHIFYFIQPFDIGSMTQYLGWFLLHGNKL